MIFIYLDIPITGLRILFLLYHGSYFGIRDLIEIPTFSKALLFQLCPETDYVCPLVARNEHLFKFCLQTLTVCFKFLINRFEPVIFFLQ